MSRSFRKTPVFGITLCKSEKKDKAKARRAWRRALKQGRDVLLREISDVWCFGKDGKRYWRNAKEEDMRK